MNPYWLATTWATRPAKIATNEFPKTALENRSVSKFLLNPSWNKKDLKHFILSEYKSSCHIDMTGLHTTDLSLFIFWVCHLKSKVVLKLFYSIL